MNTEKDVEIILFWVAVRSEDYVSFLLRPASGKIISSKYCKSCKNNRACINKLSQIFN